MPVPREVNRYVVLVVNSSIQKVFVASLLGPRKTGLDNGEPMENKTEWPFTLRKLTGQGGKALLRRSHTSL